jgi:hypothetical protein
MKALCRLIGSVAVVYAFVGPAAAADLLAPEQVTTESGWTFAFAPYLWAAGIDGDVAVRGLPEVDVDASFLDILEHFDIGFMGVGEARYGRFGFLSDVMYLKVSDDSHVDARLVDADIDLTAETFTGLGAAEYRLIEEEGGSLDALAGARVWWVNAELDFSGAFFNASGSDSDTWVDPIIGLKGRLDFSPEFFLTSWAMIGGFGVSSEFTWDLMGELGYNASDSISLVAGYRGLSVDYENDGFKLDVVMHGPFLGAVFQF